MRGVFFIFLLLPLLSYQLDTASYGEYEILTILASSVMAFALSGMNEAVFYFYFKMDEEKKNQPLFNALLMWFLLSIFTIVIIFLLKNPLSILLTGKTGSPLVIASISGCLDGLFILVSSPFRLRKKPIAFSIVNLAQTSLSLIAAWYFVYRLSMGSSGAFLGIIVGNALVSFFLLMFFIRGSRFSPDFGLVKEMLRFGLPFVPVFLLALVYTVSDRWLIGRISGLEQSGIYGASYRTASLMLLVVTALRFAWVPNMYELHKSGRLKESLRGIIKLSSTGLCFFTVGFTLFIREIHGVLVGSGYEAGLWVAPLIAFSYYFDGLIQITESPIYCEKKTTMIPFITLAAAFLNVALNIVFIPRHGIMASAWATLATYILLFALFTFFGRRLIRYSMPYFAIFGHLVLIVFSLLFSSIKEDFYSRFFAFCVIIITLLVLNISEIKKAKA